MWFHQQLTGCLTEIAYLIFDSFTHYGIGDALQVTATLVGEIVEDVGGAYGFGSTLLVAEYQVDPLVQLARHKFRFQCHAIDAHKFFR